MQRTWLVSAIWLAACGRVDVVANLGDAAADAGVDAATDASTDASMQDAGACRGGPLVLVGDGPPRLRCGGRVAETTFRHAVCTCDGYVSSTGLVTDAFDSRDGAYTAAGAEGGGSVGMNGSFDASGPIRIGGSLRATTRVQMGSVPLDVDGSVLCSGPLLGEGDATVGRDAHFDGDVVARSLTVTGTLRYPADATLSVPTLDAPRQERGAVVVAPPCDCDPSRLLDIDALVDGFARDNDNASAGLDADALRDVTGTQRIELGCGRYHVASIGGTGDLELVVRGPAALGVAGDVALGGALRVTVEGGELDLFVAGNVVGRARWQLGDADVPSRVRFYVGGEGTLDLQSGGVFAGHVYAPRAELLTPADVEVFGSLFARRIVTSGPLRVHYDRAVLDLGAPCPDDPTDPPASCASCVDCRNQACVDGRCGPCADDADCCAPLVCAGGACVPEPF